MRTPEGSATNEPPQNSSPPSSAPFVADAVDRGDEDAVGDGVRALDGFPRAVLRGAVLRFLGRVPADGRRVDEHVGALQRGEPRAPSGYHWSQQTSVPTLPNRVGNTRKPRSPGVK